MVVKSTTTPQPSEKAVPVSPPAKRFKTGNEPSNAVLEYWVQRLADLPDVRLPTDYPRTTFMKDQKMVEEECSLALHEDTCMSLLKFSLVVDVKPFTVVLAAFACLVRKYSRDEDVVVGSSSRSFNPLLLRLNLTDTKDKESLMDTDGATASVRTLRDIVLHTKDVEEAADEHEIPFDELVSTLATEEGGDEERLASLFQVRFFNACDVHKTTLDAASCDWTVYLEQQPDAKRLLPLRLRVLYNSVLYSSKRMEEMLRQLELVVMTMSTQPDITFSELSVLTRSAQQLLPSPLLQPQVRPAV